MPKFFFRFLSLGYGVLPSALLAGAHAWAQGSTEAPAAAPTAQAVNQAVAAPAAASGPQAAQQPQRIEITGKANDDAEARRRSTASKIIVGRSEIEQYGDATLGEVIKRLPGVTLQGAPGRGGQIRMRGLGNGYTQILLDGERVQGGLSLDSINPDQIERIEIIRAPTAETGTRAIGGTINVITREGFRRRLNDLGFGLGLEQGRWQPSISWTREQRIGELDTNLSASAYASDRSDQSTVNTSSSTSTPEARTEQLASRDWRQGLHLSSRLQWRGEAGGSLMLMPFLVLSQSSTRRQSAFEPDALGELPYSSSESHTSGRFTLARLNSQGRLPLGDGRLELRGGAGLADNRSHTLRTEQQSQQAPVAGGEAELNDHVQSQERTFNGNVKYSLLLDGPGDHNLVSGFELDHGQRDESRSQKLNGAVVTTDFGDDLHARSLRLAAYGQDEWTINPHWSAYAGLRWEAIQTRSDAATAAALASRENRSKVWSPLLHAVWKPEAKGQDQVRMSLTRSYRSPTLSELMGASWRTQSANSPTNPDRAGNPDLKPELATGVDLAFEHYLPEGGLLSANLFQRQIEDLIRNVVAPQSQADGSTRYVSTPQNIGRAMTRGLELEAKFKLTALWPEAPALDLRANASVFQSRVDAVAGPNNRLAQQPGGTANLGADYRLPGLPLTLGGSLNWTPGYTTRLSDSQTVVQGRKRVLDAYALWQLRSDARLRLSASNLAPRDYETANTVQDETVATAARTHLAWRLQLELKL